MSPTLIPILILASAFWILASSGLEARPNIILIFSDDAGYADFGFHGNTEILTPNLDRLAAEGTVFTQAYMSSAVCGPSRAGLMTGVYQQRFGFEENPVPGAISPNSALDGPSMGMPADQKMMAEYLSDLGYTCGVFGKWHLGGEAQHHPLRRGFDTFYGFRSGARSFFPYRDLPRDRLRWMERDFENYEEPKGYLTDELGKAAVDFIQANRDQPFFLYLPFNAPHTPLEATEADLARFPELEGTRKIYAAMMLSMDRAIGNVLDTLKTLGLEGTTLVVFTNDNGGPTFNNASDNAPLGGVKDTHLEGGLRVPFVMKWPGKLEAGTQFHAPVISLDLLPTFYAAGGGSAADLPKLDGVNLLPFFHDPRTTHRPHQTLFWKKETRATIRDWNWKCIRLPDRQPLLFNLARDPGETQDLAAEHPELVRHLMQKLFNWELTLQRPRWLLNPRYEGESMWRLDTYKNPESRDRKSESGSH